MNPLNHSWKASPNSAGISILFLYPPEVFEPLTTHLPLFPSQSSLFVLLPLTAHQGLFAGSFLDQSLSVCVSRGSLSACYFKATGWHSVTALPRTVSRSLVFSACLFLSTSQPTSSPLSSIITAPEVSGHMCTLDHVISLLQDLPWFPLASGHVPQPWVGHIEPRTMTRLLPTVC